MGIMPTLSATTVERSSDSEDRAPVLIPTTPHLATSPSPKPYIPADHLPIDQQTEGDCHWAAAPSGASSDAVSVPSPPERFCSGAASNTGSPGSVPPQNSFSTLFSGDLLDPFLVYPSYSNTSVSSNHSHSPSDPVVPSPISVADDPTSFATQGVEVQHPFHASGGSVYYAPSPAQQVQDVIPKEHVHLQRQRYAQDHFMPSFPGPIHNFKQQNLTEEQHHCKSAPDLRRSVFLKLVPDSLGCGCQMPSIHHLLTAGAVSEPLVHINHMEARDEHYGKATSAVSLTSRSLMLSTEIITDEIVRVGYCPVHTLLTHLCQGEKSISQPRMSGSVPPSHHWPAVPLENDMFDTLPRFGKQ
ncbi:hypothetical protein J3R83DRAFT_3938 [Lanmaoa asiatica]|nr:hypothetical protein J3R83DRAFT_3938 [Lanmaoa asiatica]